MLFLLTAIVSLFLLPLSASAAVIYQTTLDTNPGWTCDTGWAFGTPTGGGGQYGCPDPTSGHTGLKVYGYNLSGDYENSIGTTRYLTTTAIDCSHYTNVHLTFWRWLGVDAPANDHASIEVSDDGSTWVSVWSNPGTVTDSAWTQLDYDISATADGQATVYIRWALGPTDTSAQYCGWNVDDIALTGSPVAPFVETYRFDHMWPQVPQPWYFNEPRSVAVDGSGNVYVVSSFISTARIDKFSSDGVFLTAWGSVGTGNGQFNSPTAVAVDGSGSVYVLDWGNNRIQKFTPDGTFVAKWGSSGTNDGQFYRPYGMAVDASGNVYVADTENQRIQKFDSDGAYIMKWGSGGTGDGRFNSPTGVAVDSAGNVYVTDKGNSRIQKFTSEGLFAAKWGSSGTNDGQFNFACSLFESGLGGVVAVDGSGNVYVTDTGNSRIQKFTSEGVFVTKWGTYGMGDGQLGIPLGLAVDAQGTIYVTDCFPLFASVFNNRIQKFTVSGEYLTQWGSQGTGTAQFNGPSSLALDNAGYLYVADFGNNRIQKFTSSGAFVKTWGSYGTGDGQLSAPGGIAIDASGNVYVAETYGQRIQKFTSEGTFVTKWGSAGSGPSQFNRPIGVAVDGLGYVYVVDWGNCRVQKFTAEGTFVTTWGSWGWGDGTFSQPMGVAVDASGSVYVADAIGHRIQKFTSDGTFVAAWGGSGSADGQFRCPEGIAVDGSGNVYVTEELGRRFQKFTSSGAFITKSGSYGNMPGQFAFPLGIAVGASGNVYVSDMINNRIQKFGPVTLFSYDKAVIVAGRKDTQDILWPATQKLTLDAYKALNFRSLGKDQIRYLSHNLALDIDNNGLSDDVYGLPTLANIQDSLTNWAPAPLNGLPIKDVVVYLADHGSPDYFYISEDATLSASQLNGWLNTLQSGISGTLTVVLEACYSGSFVNTLKKSGRRIITSTNPDEQAYFLNTGVTSFSAFFWQKVLYGYDFHDAFTYAQSGVNLKRLPQRPQINVNGTLTDPDALVGARIGTDILYAASFPRITGVDITGENVVHDPPTDKLKSGSTATLEAYGVTDTDGTIARVYAVIQPPGFETISWDNPILGLPEVTLNRVGQTNDYAMSYSGFNKSGTYDVTFYALSNMLFLSEVNEAAKTTITVDAPQHRRAVLVAGGSPYHQEWPVYARNYARAYEALHTQLYDDEELYILAHTREVPAGVGNFYAPTLAGLSGTNGGALRTWLGSDTQDLTLYLVGPGCGGAIQLNQDEFLTAQYLATLLNTLQTPQNPIVKGMVTVVVDACMAGSFAPIINGPNRILVVSTGANASARFMQEANGVVSFSEYFWTRVMKGDTVELAYLRARDSMADYDQVPGLDDDWNGIPSQPSDGSVARYYRIGNGIVLGADEPVITEIPTDQPLPDGLTSLGLWANGVYWPGRTITAVWAVVVPPGYTGGVECFPALPRVTLTPGATHAYEATYSGFTQQGNYEVKFFCSDSEGRTSQAKTCTISQLRGDLGDTTPPTITDFSPANGAVGVARYPVICFTVTDTQSGVDRNTIVMAVNGLDVSDRLTISGTPGSYAVRYSPPVGFPLGSMARVTVNAADVQGNRLAAAATYSFAVTNGVDANADGLPDNWLAYYTSIASPGTDLSPGGDPDGDGFTNAQEAVLGTDPLVEDSVPTGPDAYEDDDSPARATWFRMNEQPQRHTFHDYGDADWFVFHVNAGAVLTIRTLNLGTDADTELAVYAEGDYVTPVKTDDNPADLESVIANWPVPGTGRYYVRATNKLATKYGIGAYYDFQARRDSGGPDIKADAGTDLTKSVADLVTLNGSGSSDVSDSTKKPKWYQWTFLSKPSGSTATLTNVTTDHAAFTADRVGAFTLQLQVGDGATQGTGNTSADTVVVTATDPTDAKTVWVDFGYAGSENGTQTRPFKLLGSGAEAAPSPGIVKLKWNSTKPTTNEKPRITKALKVVSVGGPVRVGVLTKALLAQMGPCPSGSTAPATTAVNTSSLMDLLLSLQKKMSGGATGDGASRPVLDDSTVREGTTYEPVLPYTMAESDGAGRPISCSAQSDSVLAVRLRGGVGIDPASIFAPVAASTPGVSVEWKPVKDGNESNDVWVIVRPQDTWLLEDLVEVSAGGQTTTGEAVSADARRFQVETQAQQDERLANPPQALPQPKPGVDYDASGIDPTREASGATVVTPINQGQHPPSSPFQGGIAAAPLGAAPIPETGITDAGYSGASISSTQSTGVPSVSVGVDAPVAIGPQRVYEPPQRVWLPVPAGVDASALRVYYYRSNGSDRGWYPAERVEGWMVPESYLTVDVNGTTYLGFLVRHAGIIQLGIPK